MPIRRASSTNITGGTFRYSQGFNNIKKTFTDLYQPSNTTRVFGLLTGSGTEQVASGSSYTITKYGSPTVLAGIGPNESMGSIRNLSQPTQVGTTTGASGWIINSFPVMNGVSYCFIAWYKGVQTNSQNSWGVGNPIYGDYRGTIYTSLGLQGGKIGVGDDAIRQGNTAINDNQWKMLSWNWKSNNTVDAYINGANLEISNASIANSPTNNRVDCIGFTYAYSGLASPTEISGLQIYSGNLTTSQLQEIYDKTINGE